VGQIGWHGIPSLPSCKTAGSFIGMHLAGISQLFISLPDEHSISSWPHFGGQKPGHSMPLSPGDLFPGSQTSCIAQPILSTPPGQIRSSGAHVCGQFSGQRLPLKSLVYFFAIQSSGT